MKRIFIDVREPHEFSSDGIEGAINLPPSDLINGAKVLQNIPKDTELVLYCVSGSRSNVTMNILKELGYTNVINGINADHIKAKYFNKNA